MDQNVLHRASMEDTHCVSDGFVHSHTSFFAVYDGHGGREASTYCENNLHKICLNLVEADKCDLRSPDAVQELWIKTFASTDEKLKDAVPASQGSTAVTCIITGEGEERQIHCANVGDSRAILCRDGKAVRLSVDHHVTADEEEVKRVESLGATIQNGRVNGSIVLTRALGDHYLKTYLINKPHVFHSKITPEDKFLVLACDGIFDVYEDQEVVDFVLKNFEKESTYISKRLVQNAKREGSTDNLTAIVIKF